VPLASHAELVTSDGGSDPCQVAGEPIYDAGA
jgi:hypothetical protein